MPDTKQITRPSQFASCEDFQQIFRDDMNGLYLLSFLLTADHEKAEHCFVAGFENAVDGNPVFKEWARSWARREIIRNAVRVVNPRPAESIRRSSATSVQSNDKTLPPAEQLEIPAVLALEPFERFVYVMTVLERYSDQEYSVLLGCARRDVAAARIRAFQQLGSAMEAQYKQLPNVSSQNPAEYERRSSVLDLLTVPRLATSA